MQNPAWFNSIVIINLLELHLENTFKKKKKKLENCTANLPLCLQPPNKSAQVQLPAKSDAPWYLLPDESGQKQGSGTNTWFKSANLWDEAVKVSVRKVALCDITRDWFSELFGLFHFRRSNWLWTLRCRKTLGALLYISIIGYSRYRLHRYRSAFGDLAVYLFIFFQFIYFLLSNMSNKMRKKKKTRGKPSRDPPQRWDAAWRNTRFHR